MPRTPGAIGKNGPRRGRPASTDSPLVPARPKTRHLQEQALPLLAEGLALEEICTKLGVSRKTLYRWMSEEKFAADLDRIHDEVRETAMRRLRGGVLTMADSLLEVGKRGDQYDGPKVKAIELVLAIVGIQPKKEVFVETATQIQMYSEEDLVDTVRKGAAIIETRTHSITKGG
ncbi:MAG: phBC6A51 family helix-turn-helix protein [Chloroflexales bacterium]